MSPAGRMSQNGLQEDILTSRTFRGLPLPVY